MTIQELKKELGLTNEDIAGFFGLTRLAYANSSAKKRYEDALCLFYEKIKERQQMANTPPAKILEKMDGDFSEIPPGQNPS